MSTPIPAQQYHELVKRGEAFHFRFTCGPDDSDAGDAIASMLSASNCVVWSRRVLPDGARGVLPAEPSLSQDLIVQLSAALGPALGVVIGAWLQAMSGRKVRLKIGTDVEVEARNEAELENLLAVANAYKQAARPIHRSSDDQSDGSVGHDG